jgi:hypothetical protein
MTNTQRSHFAGTACGLGAESLYGSCLAGDCGAAMSGAKMASARSDVGGWRAPGFPAYATVVISKAVSSARARIHFFN